MLGLKLIHVSKWGPEDRWANCELETGDICYSKVSNCIYSHFEKDIVISHVLTEYIKNYQFTMAQFFQVAMNEKKKVYIFHKGIFLIMPCAITGGYLLLINMLLIN